MGTLHGINEQRIIYTLWSVSYYCVSMNQRRYYITLAVHHFYKGINVLATIRHRQSQFLAGSYL